MLIRAIALSIALLIGIGAIVPLATENAEAGPRKTRKYNKKQRKYKKYSKAWWRNYRAKKRKQKALLARKRTLRLRQIRLAKAKELAKNGEVSTTPVVAKTQDMTPAMLPTGDPAPKTWKKGENTSSEIKFNVADDNGSQIGSASISVVGPAAGESVSEGRNKSVGGVATTSLRRTVIDRMIRENGWVVNDFQKEVGGKKVYVVVAQSQNSRGLVQSRMFYFTEVDGRIYSVATNAPSDASDRLAAESEKVINSLQSRTRSVQQAELR